nr:zinc finger, CCHC-type [Tanacetum cinerariifolium]
AAVGGYRRVKVLEFFDCPSSRQGVEDLKEGIAKVEFEFRTFRVGNFIAVDWRFRIMDDTLLDRVLCRLNVEKLDGNIVQKHGDSKQVGFKQLGPGSSRDCEAGVFQVSNNDTAVGQRRLKDKQPEEKTNTDFLVKEQKKEYHARWKIKTSNVLDSCNQRKMSFNNSGEYKKTFIGSGVGMGSMQVLHGFEFEVKPLGDHTFEVEPHDNVDQGAGLQEVQTQNLMDYQLARDRKQHLTCKLFVYRKNNNEAAFAVAVVDKIYAHESLNFNNIVACEQMVKILASMNTRLNVEKLDGNIVQKHGDSKQVGFKQLGPGSSRDCEAGVFQVSNNDTAVGQRRLKDKQPEEKTNTDFLSEVAKHLGVAWIQQQNGLVDETNVTLFTKNARLKDDMDARSDVYVLSNGSRKCSDDNDCYYWEYTPGMFIHLFLYIDDMVFSCEYKAEIWATKGLLVKAKGNILGLEIIRDQSGNTLRVSQSRIHNEICYRLC